MDSLAAETPTTALQIPDEAIDALGRTIDDEPLEGEDREQAREVLEAVAPHLVAAELRRLAYDVFIPADSRDEAAVLLGRADQLDGGA